MQKQKPTPKAPAIITGYELTTRKQYTFSINDEGLALLLNEIIRPNTVIVNVVAILITKIKNKKCNFVKMIVGTVDPNNPARGGAGNPLSPDVTRTNQLQNERFVQVLKRMKIKFTEQNIIQVLNASANTGTPGVFRIAYTALHCNDINVISAYFGEPALIFPLVNCQCEDGSSEFSSGVNSYFIEVREKDLNKAINTLRSINLQEPFNESQLCINRNNVAEQIKGFKAKKCDPCDSDSDSD